MIWVMFVSVVCAGWMAASRAIPRWVPWLLPFGCGVFFIVEWRGELTAAQGDPQPGLVALVGVITLAAHVVAILVGYYLRASASRQESA